MLIDRHGSPAPDSIFLFAAGAAAAWGLLKILTSGASTASELQLSGSPHLVRAGAVHVTAIGCAIGASALIGLIPTAVVFPAATFTATLVYLGVVGLEMSLLERELAAEPAQDGRSAQ
jgi:hypothetical protein